MIKKILLVLLLAFVVVQFFRPKPNKQEGPAPDHIATRFAMNEGVKTILEKACMDCHSNNTRYPWYSKIQPVAWWLDDHIREGKKELNFSEYTNKRARYQYQKWKRLSNR